MRKTLFAVLAAILSLFILAEVNYPLLTPQSQLAIFALIGLVLVYLKYPLTTGRAPAVPGQKTADQQHKAFMILDWILIILTVICFGYVLIQSEPLFSNFWIDGQPLGNRAGQEKLADYIFGAIGLLVVFEATRRAVGLTLPLLSLAFLLYAAMGQMMPDWLFPHRGYNWDRIVSQTFLHSQGVFGIALKVMFTYVFLFVLFGTLLEKTGATEFIINFTRRLFHKSTGGSAKVAVLSSGMMGSLSGSAVANTATTGAFTIPIMRNSGFSPSIAGGIEAAASSGGALMPPIMGAGAYMMLEIIEPAVSYLEIIRAALIPAILYYTVLLMIVHFYAKRMKALQPAAIDEKPAPLSKAGGMVFFGAFAVLIVFLVIGYTPFRAVTVSLFAILGLAAISPETRVNLKGVAAAMVNAAHGGVALVAAAACVGMIIGVVTLTGIGAKLPTVILSVAQNNLILALILLMISTIILGMGLPSAVCYLLTATLVGPLLGDLGVVPLAAHLFIFYFGMMSMVTPPVALAAYTAAAIANSGVMSTAFAAFRFALAGFALPFAFVMNPELLLTAPAGSEFSMTHLVLSIVITFTGTVPLAAGISGYWFGTMTTVQRIMALFLALILFFTTSAGWQLLLQIGTLAIIAGLGYWNWRGQKSDVESD